MTERPAFSFFSPEVQQDPYSRYARARAEEPIFYCEDLGMWVVTRHADVAAILRDTDRFSSRVATTSVKEPPPEVMAVMRKGFPRTGSIVQLDPPEHTAVRRKLNAAFTADRIAALEGTVVALANELVDAFVADGRAELMSRFCGPLPVAVIAGILGVSQADASKFGQWADDAARLFMGGQLPTDEWVRAAESVVAMQHHLAGLVTARASEPSTDLLTTIIQAATDPGGQLDVIKAVTHATTFVFAGHKTTTDLLGNAVRLLLLHPDRLAALVRDPSLAAAVVEETLRRDCPVPGTTRVARVEVKLGDVTIPADARVFLALGSANHDERVIADPLRFDPERPDVGEHLGFGRGVHFCLGAALARLQGRVGLSVLASRLPGLRLAGDEPLKFRQVVMFRGLVALEVAWDAPTAEPRSFAGASAPSTGPT
ncbi:cytochrome P450 [Nannocystis sp. RBIL2]|uniref:cytochrome P450 n=1 Tax=Nannocystis sp. RBIL2 TaxID=2996788 RepID=UPI00226EB8B0|nr:cytochrome P450 [Nannocystis sp. RBIL2]MCY1065018.1 cytochrome P450 [Nannocystis sp. RBIL2]